MKKFFLPVFFFLLSLHLSAQTAASIGVWLDHLPYNEGVDIVENDNLVYAATRQGLFTYNNVDKTIERLSKVNGLSDVGLTCLGWSEQDGLLLIGYENGNIDILEGGRVTNVPEIKQSGNFTGLKRINEIEVVGNQAYICTNFGIVQYDLQQQVVRETFRIGPEGSILAVTDILFTQDSIYAATPEGLFSASLSSQLISYENWHRDQGIGKPISQVDYFDGKLMAVEKHSPSNDSIFYRDTNGWKAEDRILFLANVKDMRVDKGVLLVSNGFSSVGYREDFSLVFNIQAASTGNPLFTAVGAAMGTTPDNMWVIESSRGLYQGYQSGNGFFISNHQPNAPSSQSVIKLFHDGNRLFVSPGAISQVWAPEFNNEGYYELEDYIWTNHSNEEFKDKSGNGFKDIVAMISDPNDPSHYYASSYGNGILEFKDGQYVGLINYESTGGSLVKNQSDNHRIGDFSADPEGNIWFTNSFTDEPLSVLRQDGTVEGFSLGSAANSSTNVKNILYTSQDQIWIQTRTNGIVVAFFEDGILRQQRLSSLEGSGNLPDQKTLSFVEDLDGEIWIGTDQGIAVLYSPQNIFEPNRNYDAQIIVIDEDGDGNGERVLGSETVNDIEVDGSNKKWFATASSGVFYTSENGKEQIYNFNRNNSPLPSDNVLDIAIDDVTGMVYFATDQGIVSFQGGATEGVESHTDVFAYPNPVEPGYEGPILIRGLVTNAQVKITDIEGNIVYETVAEGGQAIWSGRNFSGQRAHTGVYLAYITNDDGTVTAVTKIMIVN